MHAWGPIKQQAFATVAILIIATAVTTRTILSQFYYNSAKSKDLDFHVAAQKIIFCIIGETMTIYIIELHSNSVEPLKEYKHKA